jgi:hypothetical protein
MGMHAFRRGAAAVVAAAGLIAWAAIPAQAARDTDTYTITIGASSNLTVLKHAVVIYSVDLYDTAQINGDVSGDVAGDTAVLYSAPYGSPTFTSTGMSEGLDGSGTDDPFSFMVTPTAATQYEVDVFSLSSTTPDVVSGSATVFVLAAEYVNYAKHPKCGHGKCSPSAKVRYVVPPTDYKTESHKRVYMYSTVTFGTNPHHLPLAKRLKLDKPGRDAHVSKVRKISSDEFGLTVTWVFQFPRHKNWARWDLDFCTKDALATDGLGLPGHHPCGDKYISRVHPPAYLGPHQPRDPAPQAVTVISLRNHIVTMRR